MTPLEKQKRIYSLVIYIPIAVGLLWLLLGAFSEVLGFNSEWEEDFESYEIGQLWDGNVKWEYQNATSNYYWVKDEDSYQGSQSGYIDSLGHSGYTSIFFNPSSDLDSGSYQLEFNIKQTYWYEPNYLAFYFYTPGYNAVYFKLFYETNDTWSLRGAYQKVNCSDGAFISGGENHIIDSEISFGKNVWIKIFVKLDFSKHTVEISGNNGAEDTDKVCFWFDSTQGDHTLKQIDIIGYRSRAYFDFWNVPEVDADVWGINPISGSEITDLDTLLTLGWEGLEDYDSLYITFQHKATGIFTNAVVYDIVDLGGSGEKEINLLDFNIDKNANWYLHAVATYGGYQYEGGYFLSGYGWNWTGDLTDGDYYLDINIGGFEQMFGMTDFETWYGANAKFDTPTDMFYAIAGFFEPIFSVIGEFGNRISDYFNVNESYGQGYEVGRTIAYFNYFVDEVSLLLGGFPILLWLMIIMLILTGFFIFRLVLKFIPFLGGS